MELVGLPHPVLDIEGVVTRERACRVSTSSCICSSRPSQALGSWVSTSLGGGAAAPGRSAFAGSRKAVTRQRSVTPLTWLGLGLGLGLADPSPSPNPCPSPSPDPSPSPNPTPRTHCCEASARAAGLRICACATSSAYSWISCGSSFVLAGLTSGAPAPPPCCACHST